MTLFHVPRKRFGQNFLKDEAIIHQIINAIHLSRQDNVIEIGPGLGIITTHLIKVLEHLYAIEIDRDIAARLLQQFSTQQLTLYCQDVLKFDFSSISGSKKIIGNLPYNISTPLLFYLANFINQIDVMYFMLQKEVAERLLSTPSSSNYGRLTILIQYDFTINHLFDVPADAFWPKPAVSSSFICMKPSTGKYGIIQDKILFKKLVSLAFSQRRKTIHNALKTLMSSKFFEKSNIDPDCRAENLSVFDFVRLANELHQSYPQ